jgi:hypothetical protein
MTYVPAFSEIFLGFVVAMIWAAWLNRRGIYPQVTFWLPFAVGGALLAGQLAATSAIVTAQSGGPVDPTVVEYGRWGSAAAVLVALVMEAAMTATGRRVDPPAAT